MSSIQRISMVLAASIAAAALAGCDGEREAQTQSAAPTVALTTPSAVASAMPVQPRATGPRVVFLGDSLTAGYGLEADQAFPALLERMLRDAGLPAQIVNAGVSGDTTAGGLGRIDWLLRQSPDVLVIGLGGNDGLRGVEPKSSEENLRNIIRKAQQTGTSVLLLGMMIPPNYGPDYTTQFREIYPRLARELNVPLVPFLLEGVGGDAALNQSDGIHPTADGQRILADNVFPFLQPLVRERMSERSQTSPPPGQSIPSGRIATH